MLGGSRTALDRDLRRAGYYKRRATDEYSAVRNVMVFGTLLLTAAWLVATADVSERMTVKVILIGLCTMIVLFAVLRLFVQWQGNRRIQQIQEGLPDPLVYPDHVPYERFAVADRVESNQSSLARAAS